MSSSSPSIRDALYEVPGPKMRAKIRVGTAVALVVLVALIALVVQRFYVTGQLDARYWSFFLKSTTWSFLITGLGSTFSLAFVSGVIALVLGMLLMLGRISAFKPLSIVCQIIINFFRGIPSLLLIYFFFLVVPQYGFKISSFWMMCLPISLAAGAVLAEVFRAGVNAVPKGQVEAAYSIGLTRSQMLRHIVLPQAIRFVIPSLITQLVSVVKDTTLAYVVSYPDLMQNGRVLISSYDALLPVYFVVAIIYILINYAINKASVYVSHRMGVKIIR